MKTNGVLSLAGTAFVGCLFASSTALAAVDERSNSNTNWVAHCVTQTKNLHVSIYDDGHVSVGSTSLDLSELDWFLKNHVPKFRHRQRVFICADRHVRYRVFMDVINHLSLDGFHKMSLVAENITGSPPGSPSENVSADNSPVTTPK